MSILKVSLGTLGVIAVGVMVGAACGIYNAPEPEASPTAQEGQVPEVEVPILNLPERESQQRPVATEMPQELPSTAANTTEEPTTNPSYDPYCNAPKFGAYSIYTDEEWCSQAQWLRDNNIDTEQTYVARYSRVCPDAQPQNIHTKEWQYYAAIGGRTATWPTPEHYAETAWNEKHQGRLSGVWQTSTFANLGLPSNYANNHTFLYINLDTLSAYWESETDDYDPVWEVYTTRTTAKLQELESKYTSLCK